MCPEHQILSVYLDGELPSPWKEKMESHLAGCPGCRKKMETYRAISASGAAGAGERAMLERARERVWRKLEAGGKASRGSPALYRVPSVWRKSISVPVPALAAAALLLVLGAFWLLRPAEDADV
ncbi:MAG: zf-HC2 domain-containing protein, partial [Treponema sp.]|nr:zf-HC2 domain-containing protein [Treponema sp.]